VTFTGKTLSSKPRPPPLRLSRRAPSAGGAVFPVVAIGASAGGPDAVRKLLGSLPVDLQLVVIVVQHLDPTHESMMVDLLSDHTSMTVQQAVDGMLMEPRNVYLIPPGTHLSIANGALKVVEGENRVGRRLPFDHLLNSLAASCGERAICVVLTGTGSDGSLGLLAVKANGGLVIAQDPEEAEHDGMPRSAVSTGGVDLVLPLAQIGAALAEMSRELALGHLPARTPDAIQAIVELLRETTLHDFTLYKQGTLRRRIERRTMMTLGSTAVIESYLELLKEDREELALLAKDLLIHVTSFFRDPEVFSYLAEDVVPQLIAAANPARPLRLWIAGCSTGEESYALAMLFREALDRAQSGARLQVFASDIDAGAVAIAREGFYAKSIEAQVSAERLGRFFVKEDGGYRVSPELRSVIVFAVQDVLGDPPFSNIDLVSCRNLMIYLEKEAQATLVTIFHFALRESGVLLLGNAEAIGDPEGRFDVLSKAHRIYRRADGVAPRAFHTTQSHTEASRLLLRPAQGTVISRQAQLAELCRRVVSDTYGPASVLINRRYECLYSMGPTDRFLSVPVGQPSNDLLTLARPGLRTELRSAIQSAMETDLRVSVPCNHFDMESGQSPFSICAQPIVNDGEQFILVSFLPAREAAQPGDRVDPARDPPSGELERLLAATRAELQGALRDLEIAAEEHRVINEEALSVNEEYQSTNEELHTSKEELESLNEELTAVNTQLQETLERQRTTSNDLKNVLDSTDLATLFLDASLNIRFFTPTTRSLFAVIPSDIGRPLGDLRSLADDDTMLEDARIVLGAHAPIEREVRTRDGAWYLRRVLPYRTKNDGAEGVVITFADITESRLAADALEAARREAEAATMAKSRFLASVSHDLRQPLQTLALVQDLLAKTMTDKNQVQLLSRFDDTLGRLVRNAEHASRHQSD
jgi:two-component system CheB/CheR fusion protein